MYDLIIVGSGPAGLSAAIYATRARLSFIIIEQNFMSGGQVVDTYEVDNYPGLPGISGMDLAMKMRDHADHLGAEFVTAEVTKLELTEDVKKVYTEDEVYEAKTVILATGASHRKLGIPGESALAGMGVSYCATCDGAF
ncbi:MAG: FAD-dependent oxidoreductase, partial [Lachnospiraceae bacterium]|nr:FAD-dependent oxidoreductase [Lachnospiraceae bacterium]